ncbi:YjaA family stress response protein [Xenorhabdus bovienii]|uniref:YjaA family stress response protein n=1 Tax=Xenorhabdus bovienii TaxID=40576 RepID=UPI003DA3249C
MADFYLKIKTNQMILKNLNNQRELAIEGNFSSSRLLVGDFYNAELQLRTLFTQHGFMRGINKFFGRKHRVLIHPLDQSEGGLCSVEERVLLEMVHGGFQARTKKVVIHQSERLLSDVEAKNRLNIG